MIVGTIILQKVVNYSLQRRASVRIVQWWLAGKEERPVHFKVRSDRAWECQ